MVDFHPPRLIDPCQRELWEKFALVVADCRA
jgi:hypothetical protein